LWQHHQCGLILLRGIQFTQVQRYKGSSLQMEFSARNFYYLWGHTCVVTGFGACIFLECVSYTNVNWTSFSRLNSIFSIDRIYDLSG
jgi:hypothetical protein